MSVPNIRPHLLWEYDMATFDYSTAAAILIERVVERGTIQEWQEIVAYYGKTTILEVVAKSSQLSPRDKAFAAILIPSNFLEHYATPL